MKLTPVERLMLSHQCRILAALYPDEAESYDRWREAIESGYALHYDDMAQHILPELSEDECREVLRIMSMFEHLMRAYEGLADKSGIELHDVRFYGFDGNEEGHRLGYVRYLVDEEHRFRDLKGDWHDHFNSHMPMLDRYRSMYREWERSTEKYKLTKEDLVRIVSAR
jgi:uncharacterized protein